MKLLYTVALTVITSLAIAQPGGLDKLYIQDFGVGSKGGADNQVLATGKLSDGSIIAAGYFTTIDGFASRIIKFKADGTIDTNFAKTTYNGFGINTYLTITIQADDKILVGGEFDGGNIMRLNSNGTVDETFKTNIGTGATDGTNSSVVNSIVIQPDGKILVSGAFQKFNGASRVRIVRLNSNGTVDNSFTTGEGADGPITSVGIQSTGKIIIGGVFTKYDGNARPGFARLNDDGSIDAAFNPNSFAAGHGAITGILVLPSTDKLIVTGAFQTYGGQARNQIVKINADGSLDTGFTSPLTFGTQVYALTFYDADNIMVGGSFTAPQNGIAKIKIADGTNDAAFKPYNIAISSSGVRAIAVNNDGKVFIGGDFIKANGTERNFVARLLANGNLEGGRGVDGTVYGIAAVGSGKQMIVGEFAGVKGVGRTRMAVIDANGNLDTSFDPGAGTNGTIFSVAKDANGKYIIVGGFTNYRGVSRNRIARINSDGTLDTSFDPGSGASGGANDIVRAVEIDASGNILIGGDFVSYKGAGRVRVARILTNGDPDPNFLSGNGVDGSVRDIAIQSSTGKIIIVGNFNNVDGTARKRVARLTTVGGHDLTFDPGAGADATIYSVAIDANQRPVIGGGFTIFDGVSRKGIARLSLNGTIDTSFDPGDRDYNSVRTVTIPSTGNIFVGGDFADHIDMIQPSGVPVDKYYPNTPPNGIVNCSSEEENGVMIIGGAFTSFDDVNIDRIARVANGGKRDQKITFPEITGTYYLGGDDVVLGATSTSGLAITYSSNTDTIAMIVNGGKAKMTGAGTAVITASQPGNEEFNAAIPVVRNLVGGMVFQNVTFDPPTEFEGPVGSEIPLSEYASTDSGLPITFTTDNENVAKITVDGKKLVLVSTGSINLTAVQKGSDDYHQGGSSVFVHITIGNGGTTGLEDEAHQLIAYPNPTEGPLTIQLPQWYTGKAQATVVNSLGVSLNGVSQQAGRDIKLDMSALPKGIYMVRIQGQNLNTVKRVHRK